MNIPIKISVDFVEGVEDLRIHELVVAIPGAEESETIALMESNEEGDVEVAEMRCNGLDALDDAARDRLLIDLFRLAHGEMIENDGSAIEWWIADISRFLRTRFIGIDAAAFSFALSQFVPQGLEVQNMVIVRVG